VKTSEANIEFSYDSRNRAEVARESGNRVENRATVFTNVGQQHELFRIGQQYAAPQLALSFLFEQMQWSTRHCGYRKNEAGALAR
jgi:hypothetical protein